MPAANQISVLSISESGLDLVDVVDSGGTRPISLTAHDNLLYVLNEGGTPNYYWVYHRRRRTLTALAGSTQPLIGARRLILPRSASITTVHCWL